MTRDSTTLTILPTPFVKRMRGAYYQQIRFRLSGEYSLDQYHLAIRIQNVEVNYSCEKLEMVSTGAFACYIPLQNTEFQISCRLELHDKTIALVEKQLSPPTPLTIHVIQTSHHDVGYIDLPSRAKAIHAQHIKQLLVQIPTTFHLPSACHMRISIEQSWAVFAFLETASNDEQKQFWDLVNGGYIEIPATFGNMTTEICHHEDLIQSVMMPRQWIKPGIAMPTIAYHNDITGMTWGYCEALAELGVVHLYLGIPDYYSWGAFPIQSSWNLEHLFDHKGPGAFWWISPSGKSILVWADNKIGGDYYSDLPTLQTVLEHIGEWDYPYSVMRWSVLGGMGRDNSPYISDYSTMIYKWNQMWDNPTLICSTTQRFHEVLSMENLEGITRIKGDLPGQDYPIGASSTTNLTAIHRNNQVRACTADLLHSIVRVLFNNRKQDERVLHEIWEHILWYDEHTWGHHFPAGPAADGSRYEKGIHAVRSQALIHDIIMKSLVILADGLPKTTDSIYILVFNPTQFRYTGPIRIPFRELDNVGIEMGWVEATDDPRGIGFFSGFLRGTRHSILPPHEWLHSDLVLEDLAQNETVPAELVPLSSIMEPEPFTSDRIGLSLSDKQYGSNSEAMGLLYNIEFVPNEIPSMGYRVYQLQRSAETKVIHRKKYAKTNSTIENEFFRIETDSQTGFIKHLIDKRSNHDWIDPGAAHNFGELLIRRGNEQWRNQRCKTKIVCEKSLLSNQMTISYQLKGFPQIYHRVTLYSGIDKLYWDVSILKDAEPCLEVYLAFPFHVCNPQIRYESPLAVINAPQDYFLNSCWNHIAFQNWLEIYNPTEGVLFCSLDTPNIMIGNFTKGYISPAHTCIPMQQEQTVPRISSISNGYLYPVLYNNNFGTNFSVSQSGTQIFRFIFCPYLGEAQLTRSFQFGQTSRIPIESVYAQGRMDNDSTPKEFSFCWIDNPNLLINSVNIANTPKGIIIRIWNGSYQAERGQIVFNSSITIKQVYAITLDDNQKQSYPIESPHTIRINIASQSLQTFLVEY